MGVGSGWALRQAYAAFDAWPINVGVLGRGSSAEPGPLIEALEAGVCGFKVHEDTGAHLRTLDMALAVAEEHDVAVALHTDGLNEGLSVEDTLAVLDGRAVHAFHVEGCGGGHTPNVLRLAGVDNVLASSTNPTLPFGVNALAEHVSMIMVSHGLHPEIPGDLELARNRVRAATMGAENLLHDHGVIPMTSSDALGMGRAGETWRRTFALAAVTKGAEGGFVDAEDDAVGHDNDRVLRYLAKLTVNPALVHGIAHEVGSLQLGRMADIVLWRPSHFAAKPALVLKSGLPAWGPTGDPNASIDTVEPLRMGPQFGGYGAAPARCRCCSSMARPTRPTSRSRQPAGGSPCGAHARCDCRSWSATPDWQTCASTPWRRSRWTGSRCASGPWPARRCSACTSCERQNSR